MRNLMEGLVDIVSELVSTVGYFGVFLGMLIENIFPPLPSEIILGLTGFLVGRGEMSFWGATLAATLGTLVSGILFYAVSLWGGRPLILKFGKYIKISEEDLDYTERWFATYGGWVVFFGRFLPIIRTLVSIPAGLAKMHFGKFLLFSTFPAIIWSGGIIYAGRLLGENYHQVGALLDRSENILLLLVVFLFVAIIYWYREVLMKRFFPMSVASSSEEATQEEPKP